VGEIEQPLLDLFEQILRLLAEDRDGIALGHAASTLLTIRTS
jgi:hypothetical protein